ncbi:hypothetical protein FEM48_Zijuj07G0128900 [Ziziphus jujuba var. spinosa]|uniref:Alpha/beta hydrolase fold-3 domain-containing protein n=1 Tax=Ziziphus jujuba var. spinosa TaxID=714518 RepID=A0A978V4R6_ZIZJJ|nr:hypothetical protein FEM48_Zijuj07G0128900 [Ziziphus jujuba var. spinosa]
MESNIGKEVVTELLPLVRVYKDGSVERLSGSPFVPPSMEDPETGVSSKDITISSNPLIRARLFLPKLEESESNIKIPILVYYHGGGFLIESAFSADHHRFLNSLVSQAKIVAVSVEYRLPPENPLPAAYEDCWAALQWVSSFSSKYDNSAAIDEPWLNNHGDFERVFIGGDSAGANIAHNIAMRAGKENLHGGVKILGALLTHPYFWGSKPSASDQSIDYLVCSVWNFVYPNAPGGIDNPMINPLVDEAPSLEGLGCCRLLVSVAECDWLRDRGVWYSEAVKKSGWKGEVELIEIEGEDHAFQILRPGTENANRLIKRLADFLSKK